MKIYEILQNSREDGITDVCIMATGEDGNQLFIPTDLANSDYQEYLASLEAAKPETE
jgi:hypothetical protein